ncbi:hypothetical protein PRIPAC_83761 [Pristionchus pacificus]|uniref:BZIP domain-containing protein n=1 Tax=Pristionchus pacificus TaxID=54126 RepID=A0A2A6BLR4_PRIPA|nr:hypothetical protein PRIPAC_83761 [Pristionchus pacificus]|eukprot:PDM66711.1 hypothetical protein PRIPAC_48128 [Pristionchus pacificus]
MAACSPSSSSSSSDISPSLHSSLPSSQSSAFSAFQPFMMQQQILALLQAQLQSALPIPSATMNTQIKCDSSSSDSEPMDTVLDPVTIVAPPQMSLLATAQSVNIPPPPPLLNLVLKEELLPVSSESPSSTVSSPRKKGFGELDKSSDDYKERRRKNNDSARRSREVRRIREQSNRERMQVLEVENGQLRQQINSLRMELSQLQLLMLGGVPSLGALSTPSSSSTSSSSRFGRASSYDPFSTSSSYSRPSRFDSVSATGGTYSSFGSSDRLSTISSMSSSASLSHRPPVYPSSASSSLMSRSYGNPSTTSYSRASVTRDTPSRSFTTTSSTGPSRDYSGFSSYRSSGTTGGGGYGTSSYSSRPPYTSPSYSSTTTSASSYTPRVTPRYEYRSKTPGFSSDYSTTTPSTRRDRDYRSVSRFERATPTRETPTRERKNSDEVERTFQCLYNRYVRDASSSSNDERTPMCSPTKELTPVVVPKKKSPSPMKKDDTVKPKEDSLIKAMDKVNAISSIAEQAATVAREKAVEAEKKADNPVTSFTEKFADVGMQPVLIPKRDLKPASSQMDRLLKNEKTIEAIERKSVSRDTTPKAATPVPAASTATTTPAKPAASSTPKVPSSPILKTSVSATTKPPLTTLKKEPSPAPKATIAEKEASPAPKIPVAKKEASLAPKTIATKEASPAPKPAATAVKKEASPAPKSTVNPEVKKSTVVKEPSPAPLKTVVKKEASPAPTVKTPTVTPTAVAKPPVTKENSPAPKVTPAVVKKEPRPAHKVTVAKKEASPAPKTTVTKEPSPAPKPAPAVVKKEASPVPKIKDQSAAKREASPAPKRRERSRSREPSIGVTIVLGGEGEPKSAVDRVKERSVVREGSPSTLIVPQRSARKTPEKETKKMDSPPDSATLPKRRDRTSRTLDALKTKLEEQKKEGEKGEDADKVDEMTRSTSRPPMLLVTQPSLPSTPRASTSGGYVWEDARSDGTDDDDEEEEDSDTEFCVSETFRIEQPRVHLGILDGGRSSKSPFGSDFDSDIDMSVFLASPGSGRRESRGRVGAGAALPAPPPPIFTASITFDGQEDCWDSAREDDDDEYRPGSSAMGVYLSPAEFSSDESFDGEHYHDSVAVGCTLTLCQKAALRGDDETDSEEYESEEYSDESWYEDEDEEYDEDEEEYGSEYEEDEEEYEDEEDVSRWSEPPRDSSPAPRFKPLEADVSVDMVEYEEVDGEMGASATLSFSKATTKRILKDGQSERPDVSVVAQSVVPCEESVRGEEVVELKKPTVETSSAKMIQSSPIARRKDINVVPTYVKPQEEKVRAEETGRLAADRKTATDFAKKSVIQPPKLAKADVKQIETKIGEEKPKPVEEPKKDAAKPPTAPAAAKTTVPAAAKPAADAVKKTEQEDKSAARKSVLNMSAEEAKKKEKEEKEAAESKARRFGTVTSLTHKFNEELKEKEEYSYKRSSRLTQRDEERPRKKYEIVKPVINDDFDKQVAELRSKMKTGTTQLQSQMMELNKGILSKTEEAKLKELEDKHKTLINKASGVFGKADEEKERWKKARDAETEKDLIKIEEGKRRGRTPQPEEKKMDELKPVAAEPKRTVRKINRDKSPTPVPPANAAAAVAAAPEKTTAASGAAATKPGTTPAAAAAGKIPAPPAAPPAPGTVKKEKEEEKKMTPKPLRKTMNTQPISLQSGPMKMPDAKIEVNDNNADLFEAVAIVATKRKKSIIEMRNAKEEAKKERLQALREGKTIKEIQGPKGDGAAATKIRNAQAKADDISQASSDRSANKRYSARRKTQELVNPSTLTAEPKAKRRRRSALKRRRYTRDPHDIDIILGWDKENTFEQLEKKFNAAEMDKMGPPATAERSAMRKRRRQMNGKIWISELTDIDKIYKTSELRDIQASVG